MACGHRHAHALVLLLSSAVAWFSTAASAQDASATAGKAAAAKPGPFLGGFLRQSRIAYPLRLGKWIAQGEHLYEEQALGVSVRYSDEGNPDRWIDLYFYPAGTLDAAQFEQAMQREVQSIALSLQGAGEPEPQFGKVRAFKFMEAGQQAFAGGLDGRSIDLDYEVEGSRRHSAMALLLHDLYYVKARFSIAGSAMSRSRSRALLEDFIGKLMPQVSISSTGGCWMPLPIEKIERGTEPPKDAQGTIRLKDVVEAYVYQDRIVAYDPGSPIAMIGMMMIMREHGRYIPGCDAGERLEEIKEGMREIRLEFHAPGEGADGTSVPLRSPSGGDA